MLLHVFRLEARAQRGIQGSHLAPLPGTLQALVYRPEALQNGKCKIVPPILFPHKIKLGEKWGGRKSCKKTHHRNDDQCREGVEGPKTGGPKARCAIQRSFMPFSEIGMWAFLLFLKLL